MTSASIAHYKITAKLGQGGMGAVYRATDTKLDREVAVKVLPEFFAQDRERLARFGREAKALAALNHPSIAAIFGIEQTGNSQALILELVEGEDLSERLKRGRLPVEEALEVCKQIAEALEAAHEKGIIHRDLKPGNIKLLPDGRVKVLDFGLAKVIADTPPTAQGNTALEESPTVVTEGQATLPGVLLGTAGYMSPEQARGKPVDKRSDIWSFGVVLFEGLTGKRLFSGETVTDSVGALLHKDIAWSQLPPNTPPIIQLLLTKCLVRDRKRRLHDIADARIDLEESIADPSGSFLGLSAEGVQERTSKRRIPRPRLAGLVLAVAVISIALGWLLKPQSPAPTPSPQPVRRISMDLGVQARLRTADGSAVRFSRDGSMLAFLATVDDASSRTQLYLRRLDQLRATPVTAAETVDEFCFSPDGKWVAFRDYKEDVIKKVELTGGSAIPLCRAEGAYGIDWSDDGWIVFAEATGGLLRVASSGGTSEPLTTLTGDDLTHRWPHVLPGGRSILFTAHVAQGAFESGKIMFQRLPDGEPELIATRGSYPQYVSSGHVVFLRDQRLFGIPFDPSAGPSSTEPMPLDGALDGMVVPNLAGAGHFDVSTDGLLIYQKLRDMSYNLAWVDRVGTRETLVKGENRFAFHSFDLSPDGRSLVYNSSEAARSELWVYDIAQGVPRRLTFGSSGGWFPLWSPGGNCIVYAGGGTLFWKYADGSGEAHRLYEGDFMFPRAWHPSGSHLVVYTETRDGASDLRLLELKGDDQSGWQAGQITEIRPTPSSELNASSSPDGRWLAYDSDESGRYQVYVVSFPDLQGLRQISLPDHDAYNPLWSSTTNELLYMTRADSDQPSQVYSVPYSVEGGSFVAEEPAPWPSGTSASADQNLSGYDIHPDGKRLLVRTPSDDEMPPQSDRLVLVEGFSDQLREQLPAGGQ